MATTTTSSIFLSSLSHPNNPFNNNTSLSSSLLFKIPKKTTPSSSITHQNSIFSLSINNHELGFVSSSMGLPRFPSFDHTKKMVDSFDRMTTKAAAEVVPQTSDEQTPTQTKSKNKKEKVKYPRRILDIYQILKAPVITESAIRSISKENALLFTVDVRADKKMIREAFSTFFGVKVRKVNTSIRPDGTKKAFIMLSKDVNASEVAKSIGIFPK